jgi:hypothetical protein
MKSAMKKNEDEEFKVFFLYTHTVDEFLVQGKEHYLNILVRGLTEWLKW